MIILPAETSHTSSSLTVSLCRRCLGHPGDNNNVLSHVLTRLEADACSIHASTSSLVVSLTVTAVRGLRAAFMSGEVFSSVSLGADSG